MTAVRLVGTALACVMKVPLFAPALTVSELAINRFGSLLDNPTANPAAGAGPFKEIVQVLLTGPAIVFETQDKPEICNTKSETEVVFWTPAAEAVIIAVVVVATGLAWAVNGTLVEAAGTVTFAGTTRLDELLERPTMKPPVGAALFSETVQVVVVEPATLAGLQDTPETCGGDNEMEAVC